MEATASESAQPPDRGSLNIEGEKLRLEKDRYQTDLLKWIVIAIGAVISFAVIDYGKLRLEQFRATAENERELLNAYLRATEAPEPDVWKRKLNLILNSTKEERTLAWARKETISTSSIVGSGIGGVLANDLADRLGGNKRILVIEAAQLAPID